MEKEKIIEFQNKWGDHRNGKCSKCNFEGNFPIIQNYVEPFGAGKHLVGCILLLFGLIFGKIFFFPNLEPFYWFLKFYQRQQSCFFETLSYSQETFFLSQQESFGLNDPLQQKCILLLVKGKKMNFL